MEASTHSLGQAAVGRKATEGVLEFLRTTRVGCIGTERVPPEEEEGRTVRGRREGRPPLRLYFSFVFPLFFFPLVRNFSGAFSFGFCFLFWWLGSLDYDRSGRSMDRKRYIGKPTAATAFRAACSGIVKR